MLVVVVVVIEEMVVVVAVDVVALVVIVAVTVDVCGVMSIAVVLAKDKGNIVNLNNYEVKIRYQFLLNPKVRLSQRLLIMRPN